MRNGMRVGTRSPLPAARSPHLHRLVAGCMSGTSIDGIDAALVRMVGRGLNIRAMVERTVNLRFGRFAEHLRAIAGQKPVPAGVIAYASHKLGSLHLSILRKLMGRENISLAAVHGQTVYHRPPLSWQLLNPAPIAYGLGVPVVYDLRAADLALGGLGAPITPIADFILFRDESEPRTIVNLGGFCNITHIPARPESADLEAWLAEVSGGDVCACNQLLDGLARELLGKRFDQDGRAAGRGQVLNELLALFCQQLQAQRNARRSLGSVDELRNNVAPSFTGKQPKPEDVLRTACAAIAATIVSGRESDHLILAGGGALNRTLVSELRNRSAGKVSLSDDYGIPVTHREAVGMAILGALCQDGVPITLPQVTGITRTPVAGAWIFPLE